MHNFKREQRPLHAVFVREFLQNTLDARSESTSGERKQALVTFRIVSASDGLDGSFLKQQLLALEPHLRATGRAAEERDYSTPTVLVVEEFNTTGLTGKVNDSFVRGEENQHWARFWFGEGDEAKTGRSNGRAGQGKITYNMISGARAMFAWTVRTGETLGHVMGCCEFERSHDLTESNGLVSHFARHGYWCERNEEDEDPQPLPCASEAYIKDFRRSYCLQRQMSASGTSFVIPFPIGAITERELVRAVIVDFFYSITRGRLAVEVGSTRIDSRTIFELAKSYLAPGDDLSVEYIEFLDRAIAKVAGSAFVKAGPTWNATASIEEGAFAPSDLEKMREDFQNGQLVAVRFPIFISPKSSARLQSYIDVVLQRPDGLARTQEAYIRTDLYIAGEKKLKSRPGKAMAVLIAEHEPVADFLGSAEEASHLQWNAQESRVQERFKAVGPTLSDIRNSVPRLYDLIGAVPATLSEDLLADILSIPVPEGGFKGKVRKPKRKIEPPHPPKPLPAPKRYFVISDAPSGIRVTPGTTAMPSLPLAVRLEVAYKLPGGEGNPFSGYHPFDFDLADRSIKVKTKNVSISRRDQNTLDFSVKDPDFELEVSGFNSHQRLRARLRLTVGAAVGSLADDESQNSALGPIATAAE
jgi:hypothetical protein